MKKADVIEQLYAIYRPVQTLTTGLSAAQLDALPPPPETWSIKDHVAHLGFWDRNFTNLIKTTLKLEPRQVLSGTTDEINAKTYADHHDLPAARVMELFDQALQGLVGAIELFSDDDLSEVGRYEIAKGQALGDYVVHEVRGHFRDHLEELQRLRAIATGE